MAMSLNCCCSPIVVAVAIGIFTWIAYKMMYLIKETIRVRGLIKRKQQEREAGFKLIESKYGKAPTDMKYILELSDEELLSKLQNRVLTATQVLDAFIAKSYQITKEHNCIIEYIPQAPEWAKDLDQLKTPKGPLHGLPVSIKDNCNIKGLDSTLGLGKRCFSPDPDHAVIVKVLLDLGAIPFCKTNVPQTLLSFGCGNPVFGKTTNSLNSNLAPGGSSGGESSLIAGGGSVLGIGSDIGGSVRIPAHFTGVFGFKPTKDRLSPFGYASSIPNVVGVAGVPGILAKSLNTLIKVFGLIIEEKRQIKYDPLVLPIPWDNQILESKRKLRIGYYTTLDYFPLVGDTEKVLLQAKEALEANGHTLVPFSMPDSFKMMDLVSDLSFADYGTHLASTWIGEPIPLAMVANYILFNSPVWVRRVLSKLVQYPIPIFHSTRLVSFLGGAGKSIDLWKRMGDRKQMIQDITSQWREKELDLILCPSFPFPAVPPNMPGRLQSAVVYTMIWNLFDFPSGVVKFGTESGQNIHNFKDENDFMLRLAPVATKNSVGMPISVQIVALPYQDELVLRGMKEVDLVANRN